MLSCDAIRLYDDGRLSLYYAPFEHLSESALVVIVGITPGRHRMGKACRAAREALGRGEPDADVLRSAKRAGSFAGA